jgi:predicted NAD/FAD-dependent oxidoreductase
MSQTNKKAIDATPKGILHSTAHLWRFALPAEPLANTCLFDRELQIGACGDWCAGPRVEGAFLSGMAAARRVLGLQNDAEPEEHLITSRQQALL